MLQSSAIRQNVDFYDRGAACTWETPWRDRAVPPVDLLYSCVQFDHMGRKTVSLDADVYRQIKRRQSPHESISATLRRVLIEEKDPADYLDGLFRDFGGKGVTTDAGRARLRGRQANPPRSGRSNERRVGAV